MNERVPEDYELFPTEVDARIAAESAAKLAGEKALVAFLDGLAKEERNA